MTSTNQLGASISDIEVFAADLDLQQAAAIYLEHGCLVVRGLMNAYIDAMYNDIMRSVDIAINQLDQAEEAPDGWRTPKQVYVVGIDYYTSGAFLQAALDATALDIVEAILGPNIELFGQGQSLMKEPVGGFPKILHQDSAYFEHKYEGPVAILNYVVDTDVQRGALHVVPGSHRTGQLQHIDTFSHLGLDEDEWPWEAAIPVEGQAGDAIFFHVRTVHGSKPSRKCRYPFRIANPRFACADRLRERGRSDVSRSGERDGCPREGRPRDATAILKVGEVRQNMGWEKAYVCPETHFHVRNRNGNP